LKVQTTFRIFPTVSWSGNIQFGFESTIGTWVFFTFNGHTGIISKIEGFSPETLIPNWYTPHPFKRWSVQFDKERRIILEGTKVIEKYWGQHEDVTIIEVLDLLTPSTVCALWLGKLGYIILRE